MPYWLKLQGSSKPKSAWVPNNWREHHTGHAGTIKFESGPKNGKCPIQKGDGVILAAAGWRRVITAVRIIDGPKWSDQPRWGPQWPWVLWGEAVAWVECVEDGPLIEEAGLQRSYGSAIMHITERQYEHARELLHQIESRAVKASA